MSTKGKTAVVVAAHVIKFGIPLALVLAAVTIGFPLLFGHEGTKVNFQLAISSGLMALLIATVLGLVRANRPDR